MLCCNIPEPQNYTRLTTTALSSFKDVGLSQLLSRLQQSGCYRGADKSLARPTSRCILFDGENVSFGASLVIYINSTNIPAVGRDFLHLSRPAPGPTQPPVEWVPVLSRG
jgi:hypothetical protein